MKKYWLIIVLGFVFVACNNDKIKFEKHESGLEYKIISKGEGAKVKIGDVLVLNISYESENGQKIFNSGDTDRKYLRKVEAPKHTGGSFEDGLALLSVGDSALFRINAESFLKFTESYSNMPAGIEKDENIIIKLKVIEILEQKNFNEHLEERYHESHEAEMKVLENYLKNASVEVEPTESGLYYIEELRGKGNTPIVGDVLSVNYTVKLIDGFVIETTLGRTPFTFQYGPGGTIDAWFEGLGYMRQGGKASLICPSDIAYGEEGTKDIPPYSTLIFEVELISIQSAQ